MKVVQLEAVVGELEFQKKEMIKYLQGWKVDEDTIDAAASSFDDAIHGVIAHLPQYDFKTEESES